MTGFALDEFLPYRLAVAAGRVSRAFERRYRAEAGISVPEWRVLAHLSQQGEVSVREIEARADMEKSKVSRAAARLEQQGLIEKRDHPGDGRLVSLSLTEEGRAVMARLAPLAIAFQAELQALLGEGSTGFEHSLSVLSKSRF
ncbi:MarR family winged helix-turn-helix transcriptional regulator [Paracoccus ravus]|uniref:MarR family winged helix-turn-helix transcriptional regulator n=1 Tax=Paracoccus ravus TaxID=2447760 RepID=UPI00106DF3C4|nr:MarR family winged helix-turn-helix transcriptional regulator [Paracoccus ravus]